MTEYETTAHARDLERARTEKYRPSPSCLKCTHYKMCVIARNMTPMMESMFGMLQKKDQPFKAEDLAKLCQWYETPEFVDPLE